mmetsp:Transcript_1491/g.1914  ORF Transcript_1491/g.1914 Transcript_1491/m.1914 type:complete len:263 (-) Transcript_1491:145-933(-)
MTESHTKRLIWSLGGLFWITLVSNYTLFKFGAQANCLKDSEEWKETLKKQGLKVSHRKDIIFAVGEATSGTISLANWMKKQGLNTVHWGGSYAQKLLFLPVEERINYDWSKHFNKQKMFVADAPFNFLSPYLIAAFPEATFILTLRNTTEWIPRRSRHKALAPWTGLYRSWFPGNDGLLGHSSDSMSGSDFHALAIAYSAYNQFIRCSIPEEQLIILNILEGDACMNSWPDELNRKVDWFHFKKIQFPKCHHRRLQSNETLS